MDQLLSMKCTACREGEPALSDAEITQLRTQVPAWNCRGDGFGSSCPPTMPRPEVDGIRRLEKVFRFDTFVHALAFTNTVGTLAEQEGHHPALLTEWGKVTVTWWTHTIGGLHRNDFIMAAKTDQAYASSEGKDTQGIR